MALKTKATMPIMYVGPCVYLKSPVMYSFLMPNSSMMSYSSVMAYTSLMSYVMSNSFMMLALISEINDHKLSPGEA